MNTNGWRTLAGLTMAWLGLALGLARAAQAGDWLTVATYNVQNYTLSDRRLPDGGFRPDYPKPEAEKMALRAVIRSLGADIIALQEVGGAPF